ncbi:AT-rich interactive domain-containing protein 3 isoform X2 [Amborella trichopoda]|uniref:AT-rich interactive domain-containing protein 3 isoform X2 n=1 Tax=Amborella trichopoda TaxID=13333 RepID=UPI0005D41C98|nr:AT-rich interactive domain-containing protein 3 isoform X2 [Amborella trichopoda]|eukprot:XP_011625415.1 AT-rich interactive domain-containing protein 3 isoform X2 [Amborella trichopoda]
MNHIMDHEELELEEEHETPNQVDTQIEEPNLTGDPSESSEDDSSEAEEETLLDSPPVFVEPSDEPNSLIQNNDQNLDNRNNGVRTPIAIEDQVLNQSGVAHEDYHPINGDLAKNVKIEEENGLKGSHHENGDNLEDIRAQGNASEVRQSEENCLPSVAMKQEVNADGLNHSFPLDTRIVEGDDSGTEEEQAAFMRELEAFFKERSMEFKPPKTCTTVSWSFRCFYEKALLDYERHKTHGGELPTPAASHQDPSMPLAGDGQLTNQASGSGRARRDAAARAMQGWHSQRLLGNGEVGDPIIKDKTPVSLIKREKQLKNLGTPKRKKPSSLERAVKAARTKSITKPQMDTMVVDVGPCADWVKINVRRTKDCYEVYALVPGLLREEVRVQSDPAGRLVISGEPEQPDNPWGVTPFKKVVSLPSRIDPHQTSAVVTLHGQLFVRVPFEQSEL